MRKNYNLTFNSFHVDISTGSIIEEIKYNKKVTLYEEFPYIQFIDNNKPASNTDYHDFVSLLGNPIYNLKCWDNIISHSIINNNLFFIFKTNNYQSQENQSKAYTKFHHYIINTLMQYSKSINKIYINLRDCYYLQIPNNALNYFEDSNEK